MLVIDHTSLNCMCLYCHVTDNTTLRELDVRWNDIGDNGISVITEWLLSNKLLRKLNVSYCGFSMKGTILYTSCIVLKCRAHV